MDAPVTKKIPHIIQEWGHIRVDNYAWLRDNNWQKVLSDPNILRCDIRDHLIDENNYTNSILPNSNHLVEELKGRIKQDDWSVPKKDGPYEYYHYYNIDSQYPVYCRMINSEPTLLLDVESLSKNHKYYDIGLIQHSRNHEFFAYSEDTTGSENYIIRIKDLLGNRLIPEMIQSSNGDFIFSPCSRYIFWIYRDENARSKRVYRRKIGSSTDILVYHEHDEGFFLSITTSLTGNFIFITSTNGQSDEIWIISGDNPTDMPIIVEPRTPDIQYSITDDGSNFIILTNIDNAVDFKIVSIPITTLKECLDHIGNLYKEIIPHRPGNFIIDMMVIKNYIIRTERRDANSVIIIYDYISEDEIKIEEPAYTLRLDYGYEYNTDIIRYVYSSPKTPNQWVDYNIITKIKEIRKITEIPSGYNPNLYETKRLFTPELNVPITMLYRRDIKLDGSAPVHLYGYGAYGISIEPSFSSNILSLVDRGWIHVIAHVRGGSEKGWEWYLNARQLQKRNTFEDFIGVAEYLIFLGYAKEGNIIVHGASAGGLLAGAVLNMKPNLWSGVIANVPFVDMLNSMSDATLPLTPPEYVQWGNPSVDPIAYIYIASYSPYDNIQKKNYPPVLITGGLSDSRVTYWEPAKFAAKLREYSTSNQPIMLRMNMDAGHSGAAGRFDILKEIALDYIFAIWVYESSL